MSPRDALPLGRAAPEQAAISTHEERAIEYVDYRLSFIA